MKSQRKMASNAAILHLLGLPAEIRCSIYGYIIPPDLKIELCFDLGALYQLELTIYEVEAFLKERSPPLRDHNVHMINRVHQEHRHASSDRPLTTTMSLMKTCRALYQEVGPMVYDRTHVQARTIAEACVFASKLFHQGSFIKSVRVTTKYFSCIPDIELRRWVLAMMKFSPGMELLIMSGFDRNEDAAEKGSMWRSRDLYNMVAILDSSRKMTKPFWRPRVFGASGIVLFAKEGYQPWRTVGWADLDTHKELRTRLTEEKRRRISRRSCLVQVGM